MRWPVACMTVGRTGRTLLSARCIARGQSDPPRPAAPLERRHRRFPGDHRVGRGLDAGFQVFQMELVDARWRGLAYGIVSMAMSLTYASASLFGGRIAAQWGYGRLFLIAVGLSLLGALVIWGMRRDPAVMASGAGGYTTTGPGGHPGSNGFFGGMGERLRSGDSLGVGSMRDGVRVLHGGDVRRAPGVELPAVLVWAEIGGAISRE